MTLTTDPSLRWRAVEGRLVNVVLEDGSRLESCAVISVGHGRVASAWLYADGIDVFVPLSRIADVQEAGDRP